MFYEMSDSVFRLCFVAALLGSCDADGRTFSSYGPIRMKSTIPSGYLLQCWIYDSYVTGVSCACDADCRVYNDCCTPCRDRPPPDQNNTEWDIKNRSVCFGENQEETGRQCWLVSQCPRNWSSNGVSQRCVFPDPSSVTEMTPVFGSDGLQYRNAFCAECNYAESWTSWSVSVDVTSCPILAILDQQLDTGAFFRRLLDFDCRVFYEPPDDGECRRCFPGLQWPSSVMNVTADMDPIDLDSDLMLHCRQHFQPVFINAGWHPNEYCYFITGDPVYYLELLDRYYQQFSLDAPDEICKAVKCHTDGSAMPGLRCTEGRYQVAYLDPVSAVENCHEEECLMCLPGHTRGAENCTFPVKEFRDVQLIITLIHCQGPEQLNSTAQLLGNMEPTSTTSTPVLQSHVVEVSGLQANAYFLVLEDYVKVFLSEMEKMEPGCKILQSSTHSLD